MFLVPSVPLVKQQSEFLSQNLSGRLRVGGFCGADGVDHFDAREWRQVVDEHHVLVLVHQVFLDVLLRGDLGWGRVNLLVLDECHHADKKHPYKQIMDHFRQWREASPGSEPGPRLLGLSASIVMEKCDPVRFRKLKEELEANLEARVMTTHKLDSYLKHVTNPEEEVRAYGPPEGSLLDLIGNLEKTLTASKDVLFVLMESERVRIESLGADVPTTKTSVAKAEEKAKKVRKVLDSFLIVLTDLGRKDDVALLVSVVRDFEL